MLFKQCTGHTLEGWLPAVLLSSQYALHSFLRPSIPSDDWQWNSDADTLQHWSKFARVYANLASYRSQLLEESSNLGIPLIRAMFLEYPLDHLSWSLVSQFMLGPDLLIVPVMSKGAVTVDVYLPQNSGQWTHVWTGDEFDAGSGTWLKNFKALIGLPAVFCRSGAEVCKSFSNL